MGKAGKKMGTEDKKLSHIHLTTMDHILQNPLALASASASTVRRSAFEATTEIY
jgi:hypothetical protein